MAYIPEEFGEAVFMWQLVGDPELINCTMGFRHPTGDSLSDLEDALVALEGAWYTAMMGGVAAGLSTSYTYKGAKASVRPGGSPSTDQLEVPRNIVGTNGSAPPPQNCCMLVKKNTTGFGRKNRGRMYLPFYGEAENQVSANGTLSGGTVTSYQGFLDDFMDAIAASPDVDIYLLHGWRVVDPGPPPVYEPPAEAPVEITELLLQNVIATQRRRLRP